MTVNFLTGQDTGFEGGTGNWVSAGNSTVAATGAQAHTGTGALSLTSVASGDMAAASCTSGSVLALGMPVVPGQPVRHAGWARAAAAARTVQPGADFYDAAGTAIGGTLTAAGTANTATGWTQYAGGVTAPAGAAWCRAHPLVKATGAAGEVHYLDDAELNPFVYFDAGIGRARVDLAVLRAALAADAAGAVVQRSTDQIRWSTVRGGGSVTVTASSLPVDDYEFIPDVVNYYRVIAGGTYNGAVTPSLAGQPWLKSIAYPFLNMPVTLADASDITRASRSGTFDVIGRSFPVAVTTLRGPAQFDLMIRTETIGDRVKLEALLATGEALFLQVPATTPDGYGFPVPGGYYLAGDYTQSREGMPWDRRAFTLPLTQVDAPAATVVGTTITWAGVVNAYATWSAVVTAQAAWAALVQTTGTPADVVVG